ELHRHHLAVAHLPVADEERPVVADHLQMAVELELPFLDVAHVHRDHADAVAVVALQIGLDQVVGHGARLALLAARRLQQRRDGRAQFLVLDDDVLHVSSPGRDGAPLSFCLRQSRRYRATAASSQSMPDPGRSGAVIAPSLSVSGSLSTGSAMSKYSSQPAVGVTASRCALYSWKRWLEHANPA